MSITEQSVRISEQNLFVSRYLPRNKNSYLCPLCLCGKNRFLDKYDVPYIVLISDLLLSSGLSTVALSMSKGRKRVAARCSPFLDLTVRTYYNSYIVWPGASPGLLRRPPHDVAARHIKVGKKANIQLPADKIAEFCKRNHIRRLALFGSALRDDFTPESDVDILVEFEPGHVPGFIKLAGMEIELGSVLGRKVDIRTPEDLSPYFREEVVHSAEVQYAQG